MYYNRKTTCIEIEKEYQKNTLNFLYKTIPGRIVLKFVSKPWFSNKRAKYYNSRKSVKEIRKFIKEYGIDANASDYDSFNEFFTRFKELDNQTTDAELMAVADAKVSYYPIRDDMTLEIKNSIYNLEDILQDKELAKEYKNGTCLIFRLSVDDIHHYFYPASGKIKFNKKIPGELHTVRPLSEKYNIYSRNSREVTVLETEELGEFIQIEVGALLIGKINNDDAQFFKKGDHRGYFEYGGSTIVLLFKENTVEVDLDFAVFGGFGIEVKVSAGEKIGTIRSKQPPDIIFPF